MGRQGTEARTSRVKDGLDDALNLLSAQRNIALQLLQPLGRAVDKGREQQGESDIHVGCARGHGLLQKSAPLPWDQQWPCTQQWLPTAADLHAMVHLVIERLQGNKHGGCDQRASWRTPGQMRDCISRRSHDMHTS